MNHLRHLGWAVLLVLGLGFTGCSSHKEFAPSYDEVLRYPLAYDLTYLRTVEALENMPGWELLETEKEKGIICIYNGQIGRLDDPDSRMATVLVKRVSRKETTVELAPRSRRVVGGKEMFRLISEYVGREL